ncbi:Ohr family peroxiredoxin [Paenibacillus macquariensis]|uniref:Peroxiredoxin, Ohr subfamily n=1 Tax=Paenibacillus macquariensis TaxID=948756 RepID=A0ABY1JYE1_9BACL|nr:Ohr family peroxiredoxin [Paenibacillus macquariensis]MEC0089121.1 Ohr family peroxiredoxin [Paenibacillus macquariensis]OAB33453.1 Organic hydroperoxide resistance protein OhrA [Paenibacillus macquariensis subsp. macquariensis]SIQ98198.1 peroxiredoxin, Ohr subfamily [Paenibacillus macquariensis]
MTKTLFTTTVTVAGGREGVAVSEDGNFTVEIAMPGTPRAIEIPEATNPEQLFAAGYAACFDSALQSVGKIEKVNFNSKVTASVSLLMGELHQYSIAVKLAVKGTGIDQETFETLVHKAHEMCPYSKATRGNIDVAFEITVD